MASIHQLILTHGRAAARDMVPPEQRRLVDMAAAVMAVEREEIGISYSGFALTSLPHKSIPDDAVWERQSYRLTLTITPGRLPTSTGTTESVGVPYGAYARLIMLYLQSQAVKTNCRRVELGRSMRGFLERLGLSVGGRTYERVWEQARRIAACNLTFSWQRPDGRSSFVKDSFVTGGAFSIEMLQADPTQPRLWEDEVTLGETFFAQVKAHPVPMLEQALRQISNNSAAIDVYIWLTYRLHSLDRPVPVSWAALATQFGGNYARLRDFRRHFRDPLNSALAVYPDARVEETETGLILYPSPPAVSYRIG